MIMRYQVLCAAACRANRAIDAAGLAPFTWGNASAADRRAGVMAIKPSGVAYARLRPCDMVVLDLDSGRILAGSKNPSSDAPTHLELYRAFESIGGIVHTHSKFATAWAQARQAIPCCGTTQADVFYGPVPLTRLPRKAEAARHYEANTGKVIIEHFRKHKLNPASFPGVLVAGHGPFVWGLDVRQAVRNARVLEALAEMAFYTIRIAGAPRQVRHLPEYLLDKHYLRKHGPGAYYGQHPGGRGLAVRRAGGV